MALQATRRSLEVRLSPDARRLGPLLEKPAGFVVTRATGVSICGRTVPRGAPVPAGAVTPFLESIGWIRGVARDEYGHAVKDHGRPPTGALKVGWAYRRDVPKKTSRRKASSRRKK